MGLERLPTSVVDGGLPTTAIRVLDYRYPRCPPTQELLHLTRENLKVLRAIKSIKPMYDHRQMEE